MEIKKIAAHYRQHLSRMVKRSTTHIINGAYMPWRRKATTDRNMTYLTWAILIIRIAITGQR